MKKEKSWALSLSEMPLAVLEFAMCSAMILFRARDRAIYKVEDDDEPVSRALNSSDGEGARPIRYVLSETGCGVFEPTRSAVQAARRSYR